jgi:hypothetical protein
MRIRLFAPFYTGNLSFCRVEQIPISRYLLPGEGDLHAPFKYKCHLPIMRKGDRLQYWYIFLFLDLCSVEH